MTPRQARIFVAVFMIVCALYLQRTQRRPEPAASPAPATVLRPDEARPDPAAPGPRDFYVAREDLDPALVARVTPDMVELRRIPESLPLPEPRLLVKSLAQIEDKLLVTPMSKGELVMLTRFGDARTELAQRKLRDVLPNGLRAIAVDVDALASTSGFIAQGDLVDVLATYSVAGSQLTRMIIQNVEVLAAGGEYRTSARPTGERFVRGDGNGVTFTLKVTPEMAVKLAHMVDEKGFNRFRLVLKNREDKVPYHSRGMRLAELVADHPLEAPPAQVGEIRELEIYHGQLLTKGATEERGAEPAAATGSKPITSVDDLVGRIAPVTADPLPVEEPPPPPSESELQDRGEVYNGD